MKRFGVVLSFVLFPAGFAMAMPPVPADPVPVQANDLLVHVATKAQKNAAWADCKKRFGKRLVTVKFTKTQYSCQYRTAAKAQGSNRPSASLVAAADKKCREDGMRFLKFINKSKSGHYNIMCTR